MFEPVLDFSIERYFPAQRNRRMQKRTRRSDEDAFGTEDASGLTDLLQRAFEIVPPDIPAIHDAQRQAHEGRKKFESSIQFRARSRHIQV